MGRFLHNPDGWITIEADATHTLTLMVDEFIQYEPAYKGLPSPYISGTYVQGQFHIFTTGNSQFSGPMPWAAGDTYIANLAAYQAAQTAKQKALKIVAAQAELDQTTNSLIAAMEWAVNYFINKGIIPPADVPISVTKLLKRRADLKAEIASAS